MLDACTGLVWQDDSQVVEVIARKAFVEAQGGQPRVEVVVTPIDLREWPWCASVSRGVIVEEVQVHPSRALFDALEGRA